VEKTAGKISQIYKEHKPMKISKDTLKQMIAEQMSALQQKDPDKISQARLDGATDYREHGSMEDKADYWLKVDNGVYFDDYEDAYYTAQEVEDREDYYDDLDEGTPSPEEKKKKSERPDPDAINPDFDRDYDEYGRVYQESKKDLLKRIVAEELAKMEIEAMGESGELDEITFSGKGIDFSGKDKDKDSITLDDMSVRGVLKRMGNDSVEGRLAKDAMRIKEQKIREINLAL
jgi:hypothetical protein